MKLLLLLFAMVFCHIVDDFYLQGLLASMKQKKWWEKNAPDELYKHDYIMALSLHAFSWTFLMMLPMTVYLLLTVENLTEWYGIIFFANIIIHSVVDHQKANKLTINLITDQTIHLIQIFLTWAVCLLCFR